MATTTFAAIDVGSSELSMKIYELSKQRGIRELTHVRHEIALGAETYTKGVISYHTIEEICLMLNNFKRTMSEFGTTSSLAYATSALREAGNSLVILDQIKIQTGFDVRVLSNSEARFLSFKAMTLREPALEKLLDEQTLVIDIGAGSVQLSFFNEGRLHFTQNLLLGSARIRELLDALREEAYDFQDLIDEYIERDLTYFINQNLIPVSIRHIIAVGQMIPEIYEYARKNHSNFNGTFPQKWISKNKLIKELSGAQAQLLLPTLLLCRKTSQLTGCDDIHLSGINLCDGIVAEYAEKKLHITSRHDFIEDILSASFSLADKYHVAREHIENVQTLALQIFDKIRKLHGLGKRERLLLQLGVILHSCGSYISETHSRECSYQIIMSTEIIGISHKERAMVANMVRYDQSSFPRYEELGEDFTKEEYITIVKLNAILKTANVLDKSNRQKIKKVGVTLHDDILTITADTMADITLEKGLFHYKADVFEEVFGIRPQLRQKRSGKRG